jgi:hypothetical protein
MSNPNFSLIASTTLDNYKSQLIENVFSSRPLFHFLTQSGQVRMEPGGRRIVCPLMTAENDTFGSYSGYDTLPLTAQTGITAAEYDWKQVATSIAVNNLELAQNSSDHAVVSLITAKIEQAEETIKEQMDKMLIQSDNTTSPWTSTDFHGLELLVNGNTATIGGIDSSANTYWESNNNALGGTLTVSAMRTMYYDCSKGNDSPNIILTTQTLYEKYESLLAANIRYTDTRTADAGFLNILLLDTPVMYDTYVNSGDMYFLNTNYLRLVGHTDHWFRTTPFKDPTDQDASYAQIFLYGNFTVTSRERQGVITGATA